MARLPRPIEVLEKIREMSQPDCYRYLQEDVAKTIVELENSDQKEKAVQFQTELQELQRLKTQVFFEDKLKPILTVIRNLAIANEIKEPLIKLIKNYHIGMTTCLFHVMEDCSELLDKNGNLQIKLIKNKN